MRPPIEDLMCRLPAIPAPEQSWAAIRTRLTTASARRPHRWLWPLPAAAAISGVALLAAWWSIARQGTAAVTDVVSRGDIAPLVARSQRLESLLQDLPQRPHVERAATSAAIDDLQQRIQALDLQLSAAQESATASSLWTQRVQLLDSLLGVRYAEAARNSYSSFNPTGEI
jgi:hypothetical protein